MRETDYDLRYNMSALAIAILREDVYTAEDAFEILEGRRVIRNRGSVEEMIGLREYGLSYREIGEMFGLCESAVFYRIKRHKTKVG